MIFGAQDKTLRKLENEFDVSIFQEETLKFLAKNKRWNNGSRTKKIYEEVLKNKVINSGEINAIINIIKHSNMEKEDDIDFVNSISFTG